MAFIRMNTPQHTEGAKLEDFIYRKLKSEGYSVYRQLNISGLFKLPKQIKIKISNKKIIDLLESYPFDMFLIKGNKVLILEIKSKKITNTKDDRKVDISKNQYLMFNKIIENGLDIKILVLWHTDSKYNYKIFDFTKLSVIGIKKLKLKIPQINYSPSRIKYKDFNK